MRGSADIEASVSETARGDDDERVRSEAGGVRGAVEGLDIAERSVRRAWDSISGGISGGRAEAAGLLERCDRLINLLVGVRSRVLTGVSDSEIRVGAGDRDVAAWRARTSRQGASAGVGQVRTAQALAAMPAVERALIDGEVTSEHASVLGRVSAGASPVISKALASAEGQAQVVQLARHHDGRRFARALSALTASWDPAAQQASHEAARAARFLHLSHTPEATWIKGRMDPWAGKTLRLALEAVTPRPAEGDTRTSEQRSADALELLAEHALNTPETSQATERPNVTVLMSEGTWTSVRQARTAAVAAAEVLGDNGKNVPAENVDLAEVPGGIDHMIDALHGQDPVRNLDGDTVPPSQLARLLCDCDLSRMALSAKSEVLDHGRNRRLFSRSQRQAITIRDGGCAWPDCAMPTRYAEIHHNTWWNRDHGHTSVDNGIALCSYHHHLTHQNNYRITRNTPTTTTAGPTRAHPSPRPPGIGPPTLHGRPTATYTITRPDGTTIAGKPPGTTEASGRDSPYPGSPPGTSTG